MPPRAQPGEGIVVVLDVGPRVRAGTDETFFSQSKKCVINILQRKMYAEKCRDTVGIVLCGSDETDNPLATESQYQNIKVLQEPLTVTWHIITEVEQLSGGRKSGDWLDALVVAMNLLHDPDETRFSVKKIVLMTDFSGEFSDDQTSKIIAGLKGHGIELSVIGPEILDDDDDDDEGSEDDVDAPGPSNGVKSVKNGRTNVTQNWNGKPKSVIQLAGEALITTIVAKVDGVLCSFEDAIPQLLFFQKRSSGSANWNTVLDIGPTFQIAITGRIKVKHATPPTWKSMYAHDERAVIIKETSYHRNDDAQTPVDEQEVIPGYKYGSTLVPFSDEDSQMKYNSNHPRSLSILGFTRSSRVSHHFRAGDQVLVITAREGDEAAAVALSSFIQALVELDYVGITRKIYNKNGKPVLGVLFPEWTEDYECLIWIPLPFQEDIRSFTFPSLQRTIGKLTKSETEAMDKLITAMNLTMEDTDEDDLLEPSGVMNPQLQHYFNVLTHRALHEHEPLPPPADHVVNILKPPEELIKGRNELAAQLASLFPTKKVVKKSKRDNEDLFASKEDESNKKQKRDDDDEIVSASDLTRALVTQVTSATPVEDFNALLRGEAPNFNLICNQMGKVIMQLVDSLGGSGPSNEAILSKVVNCLIAFRQESCIIDPSSYNKFIPGLKDVVTSRSLQNLWDRVKEGNLGQINSEESLKSSVSPEASSTFLELEAQPQESAPEPKPEEDDDFEDLLDDL